MTSYDPNKRYTWTPEDVFTLSGKEFGLLLNTVRAYLGSEEAARFQLMIQSNEVIEKIMSGAVENGIVKEVIPEKPSVE
jgi:predicted component of type VI protein secretion system